MNNRPPTNRTLKNTKRPKVIITVWSWHLAMNEIKTLTDHIVTEIKINFPIIGKIYIRPAPFVESGEKERHNFGGLYAGYSIILDLNSTEIRKLKNLTITAELRRGERVADIDVYTSDTRTKKLKRYSRHSYRFKMVRLVCA